MDFTENPAEEREETDHITKYRLDNDYTEPEDNDTYYNNQ